ncbi:fibrinogen-like protein 1 [Branchiostoma floridae]|uniref:Fibrinogen-like protein 1 n=1 Tax=Branchiostoma floridae TaxID=7739 RepID=A0A9J7LVQ0_BRAFL|nr:fibrinogen-like protein 1 [Branchiostoma floridae]
MTLQVRTTSSSPQPIAQRTSRMEGSLRGALLAAACCLLFGTLVSAQDQTMGPALVEGHVDYSGQMSCKIIWPTPADRAKETARIAALETRLTELEKMQDKIRELEGRCSSSCSAGGDTSSSSSTPSSSSSSSSSSSTSILTSLREWSNKQPSPGQPQPRPQPPHGRPQPPHGRPQPPPRRPQPPPVVATGGGDPNRKDCSALFKRGGVRASGVYQIFPAGVRAPIEVYCDMETDGGGWTLIQRRLDGSVAFNRGWADYKAGFGQASGEYWLGNDNIHHLTSSQGDYELRIDLTNWEGESRYAKYSRFKIHDESKLYELSQGGYSGNAGDTMTIGLLYGNDRQKFSTIDRDNDANRIKNCAADFGQGGWWYGSCSHTDLNGEYLGNCGFYCAYGKGVYWSKWKGWEYSLKETAMKIRPKDF